MLSLLIRYVADMNASGTNLAGQTALHIAAKHRNEDALRGLIRASADVFARYADGRTALHVAAAEGRANKASILLNHGLDIMTEYGSKVTPVIMAAMHSRNEMLRFLLDRCAGSMSEEPKIRTAIGAAGTGRLDNLKMFDSEGFPILGRNDLGESGLSLSTYCGYKDAVVYLLQRGADPRQRSHLNTTRPLTWQFIEEVMISLNFCKMQNDSALQILTQSCLRNGRIATVLSIALSWDDGWNNESTRQGRSMRIRNLQAFSLVACTKTRISKGDCLVTQRLYAL
jgi:hypothetical protein